MRSARQIVFVVCILLALTSALAVGKQHFSQPRDELFGILFCALVILATIGILGFITQFFAERTSLFLASVFYGFFAGLVATNIIFNIVTGVNYSSLSDCLVGYGLMLLFLGLAVAGLILFQFPSSNKLQNKSLEPTATAP
jgi:hypothetical protein